MAASATYAGKAANNDVTAQQAVRGKPVFVKHSDIPGVTEQDFKTEHMYKTLAHIVPSREITGIQKSEVSGDSILRIRKLVSSSSQTA